MRDFRNAKTMAKTLRDQLAGRSHAISHAESLELIAQVLGARNWQTLAAAIAAQTEGAPAEVDPVAAAAVTDLLPLIPMRDVVVLPDMTMPLFVARARSLRAVERAMAGDRRVFLVTQRGETTDLPSAADLFEIGVVATILQATRLPDRSMKLVFQAERRGRLSRLAEGDLLEAEVEALEADDRTTDDVGLARRTLERFGRFANFDPSAPPIAMARLCHMSAYPGVLADMMTPHVATRLDQAQALLETIAPAARLQRLISLMDEARPLAA